MGLRVADTVAPVASFVTGSAKSMQALQERLFAEGIYVLYSNYIGASSEGVIRCGIFADHTTAHFDCLLDALDRLL